ncbi:cysteine hydrolase family protein [Chloroflexota bacterium]
MKVNWRDLLREVVILKLPPDFKLEPAKTALLLVDIQNTNCNPHLPDRGSSRTIIRTLDNQYPDLGQAYRQYLAETFIPNNVKLLTFFRQKRLNRIFLTIGPELPDGRDLTAPHRAKTSMCEDGTLHLKGSYELQIIDELKPQEGELIINKKSQGAFNSTGIDHLLRNMGIEYLVITGAGTHACVELTARDAVDRGYRCILVEDACATAYMFLHNFTLYNFAAVLGKVASTEEVISELSGALH